LWRETSGSKFDNDKKATWNFGCSLRNQPVPLLNLCGLPDYVDALERSMGSRPSLPPLESAFSRDRSALKREKCVDVHLRSLGLVPCKMGKILPLLPSPSWRYDLYTGIHFVRMVPLPLHKILGPFYH
jgi:hypothetical protein